MTYSLDTNVVLRLLLGDVPEQSAQVRRLLEESKPGSIVVADAVVFESVWVLTGPIYGFDRDMVADLLLELVAVPQINCNRTMITQALRRYTQHPGISFIDACLVTYAEISEAAPLLTYDKKLARALPKLAKKLP